MRPKSATAVLERLGATGLRRTAARGSVTAAALRRTQPFTANELVLELARSGVGRATVFRTLDLLVSLGALSRIHGIDQGDRCIRYTPCAPAHHHHLVCRACGKVEDLAVARLDKQLAALAHARGYRSLGHNLEIAGICPACRRAGA